MRHITLLYSTLARGNTALPLGVSTFSGISLGVSKKNITPENHSSQNFGECVMPLTSNGPFAADLWQRQNFHQVIFDHAEFCPEETFG